MGGLGWGSTKREELLEEGPRKLKFEELPSQLRNG